MNNSEADFNKGQHLLIDDKIIKEISSVHKGDTVIEVGAGSGNITREVAKKAKAVTAYEIDEKYLPELNKLASQFSNLKVIHGDALKADWQPFTKLVSNTPFHLSEKILTKCIEDQVPEMHLLLPDDFKKKLEGENSKIGIIACTFYQIRIGSKILPASFSPPPKVNSWLVSFSLKKNLSPKEKLLQSIFKRKGKLKNAIIYAFIETRKTKNEARDFLKSLHINSALEKTLSRTTGKTLHKIKESLQKYLA